MRGSLRFAILALAGCGVAFALRAENVPTLATSAPTRIGALESAPPSGLRRSVELAPAKPIEAVPSVVSPPASKSDVLPENFGADDADCDPCRKKTGFDVHIDFPHWEMFHLGLFEGGLHGLYERCKPDLSGLERATWSSRPLSFGVFLGSLVGNTLASGLVEQEASLASGIRFGWDVSSYWGIESRIAFADPKLHDIPTELDYDEGNVVLWDVEALYYPLGDTRFRPYFLIGLGMAKYDFTDVTGRAYTDDTISLPLGIGCKYRCTPWLAVRADIVDSIALFGDTVGTLNNFSFTFGLEYRFGGVRTTYYPWATDAGW